MDEVHEEIKDLECEGDAKAFEFNAETGIALARLVASLAVSVFTVIGWTIDFNLVFNIILSVFAVACIVYGLWYKNANLTKAAQVSQKLLNSLKAKDTDDTVGNCKEGTD